jgi:ABC-type Na+ efflux pump permease subunit
MTNEQLIEKFNPVNGANLTAEDLETLRGLTDAQIDVLADAYPNKPTRRSYLRLYDTTLPVNKQLFHLSTWQNLRNVRKYSNKKNFIPYDLAATPAALNTKQRDQAMSKPVQSSAKIVVDLSAQEAADELRKNLQQKVQQPVQAAKVTNTGKSLGKKPNSEKPNQKPSENKTEVPAVDGGVPDDQQFIDVDGEPGK